MVFWEFLFILQPAADALRGFPLWYLGSFKVTAPLIWGMAMIAIAFIRFFGKKSNHVSNDALIIGGVLLWVVLVSGLASSLTRNINYGEFIKSTFHLSFWLVFFLALTTLTITSRLLISVGKVKLFIGVLVAVYGIYQYFAAKYGWPFDRLEINSPALTFGGYNRICSIYTEPIYFSLEMVFLLIIVSTAFLLKLINKKVAILLSILFGYALLLASALSGFIVILAVIAIILGRLAITKGSVRVLLKSIVFTIALMLLVLNVIPNTIKQSLSMRIQGIFNEEYVTGESYKTRMRQTDEALNLFLSNPVFGVGWGQVKALLGGHKISSLYLILLAETGSMALIFIGIIYIRIKKYLVWDLKERTIKFIPTVLFLSYSLGFIFAGYLMDSAVWYLLAIIIKLNPKTARMRT